MNRAYLAIFLIILLGSCTVEPNQLNGKAQGSTFIVKYYGTPIVGDSESIYHIFQEMDRCFSLWQEDSELNKVNNCELDTCKLIDPEGHFNTLFKKSREININSYGDFNPALYPLIRSWGFGLEDQIPPDSLTVDSLIQLADFSNWSCMDSVIVKPPLGALDMNAIAQGYTIDLISEYLEGEGIDHYFIEVGGEIRTKGLKPEESKWSVGLENPNFDGSRSNIDTLYLMNAAMATSGSYRKFKEINGKKYSHTIDPTSGYPVDHQLLSVTVIANDCATADAYATAFMVKGKDGTIEFIRTHEDLNLEVYLIYEEEGFLNTYYSEGFNEYLTH